MTSNEWCPKSLDPPVGNIGHIIANNFQILYADMITTPSALATLTGHSISSNVPCRSVQSGKQANQPNLCGLFWTMAIALYSSPARGCVLPLRAPRSQAPVLELPWARGVATSRRNCSPEAFGTEVEVPIDAFVCHSSWLVGLGHLLRCSTTVYLWRGFILSNRWMNNVSDKSDKMTRNFPDLLPS